MCIRDSLGGTLMTLAVLMTLVAVAAWRTIPSPAIGWTILATVVAFEIVLKGRAQSGSAAPQ